MTASRTFRRAFWRRLAASFFPTSARPRCPRATAWLARSRTTWSRCSRGGRLSAGWSRDDFARRISFLAPPRKGSHDRVPERRGDTEAVAVVLEVMAHVMGAQRLPELGPRHVMVQVVVHVVIGEVAEDESREDREGMRRAEDQHVETEEQRRQGDADGGGHDEPHRVVRMVVMDAVDDEVETVAPAELRLPVEEQAVEPVLGQRPDPEAGGEHQGGGAGCEASVDPEPDAADDDRDEDDRRDRRMDAGEEIEKAALEHRRRGREAGCALVRHRRGS